MALAVGDRAPSFSTQADDGSELSLDSLRGKRTILFFYPRADTGG